MSGMPDERKRAQEYLGWLFDQLRGPVYVEGWEVRIFYTLCQRTSSHAKARMGCFPLALIDSYWKFGGRTAMIVLWLMSHGIALDMSLGRAALLLGR